MANNFTKLKMSLLAVLFFAATSIVNAQDPLCPDINVAPDGTVTFDFPFDPGFDVSAIGISTTPGQAIPATTIFTGSGSFTQPNVYTLEPDQQFPAALSGTLVMDFTGTGFIACSYVEGFLPLELLSFDGRTTERNTNMLTWVTASETNTDWIVLERSSDISSWETVERVKAQGWSFDIHEYSAEDLNPYLLTYYRLRIIDLDGAEYYSNVVALERNSLSGITISPVPAMKDVFLQFDSGNEGDLSLTVVDIYGRELSKELVPVVVGLNTIKIDIRNYPSGLYYVTLDNGIDQQTKRIVKQE